MREPECTGCPEPATKICTHCHDPKCDDCMPAFLCCACDEEGRAMPEPRDTDTHRAHLECGRLHDCPAIVESPTRRYDANDPRNPSCVADAIADLTVQAARIADAIEALGKQASYGR